MSSHRKAENLFQKFGPVSGTLSVFNFPADRIRIGFLIRLMIFGTVRFPKCKLIYNCIKEIMGIVPIQTIRRFNYA